MLQFIEKTFSFPTVIPFFLFMILFLLLLISLFFGGGSDGGIDGVDANMNVGGVGDIVGGTNLSGIDSSLDVSSGSSGNSLMAFLGFRTGVNLTALLTLTFLLLYGVVLIASDLFNLNNQSMGMRALWGLLIPICLFPIVANLVYFMLKPFSKLAERTKGEVSYIVGKIGNIIKIYKEKGFVVLRVDGAEENHIVYLEKADLEKVKINDEVKISVKEFDHDNNPIYKGIVIK